MWGKEETVNNEKPIDESLIAERAQELYQRHDREVTLKTDQLFANMMIGQWLFAILLSVVVSPVTWAGSQSSVNSHVILALALGALISLPPVLMVRLYPGLYWNRFFVAVAQMAMSGLLIHLTGGRIETHFHVFGSLAFLVFYRDWKVFVPATLVVAVDHLVRGWFFPMSVYGIATATITRTLEHAAWVLFEDAFLVYFCVQVRNEMKELAKQRAQETYLAGVQANLQDRMREVETLHRVLEEVEIVGVQVTGATTSLAATAREQEASISEQASAATQIKATSREISATVQELVSTMGEVAQGADDTAGLASTGQGLLTTMQTTMDGTVNAAAAISSKLAILSEKANKIGTVVVTIGKVADHTNLLSLNAAIEAEKAGDYGRGFGVVATEIRRLADQTAVATLDIEQMIKEVQTAVSAGVMGMETFTQELRRGADIAKDVVDQLSQIISRVQAMSERFENVNYGMRSQAKAAEQIAESIGQLSDATQHTAASIREFNNVILNLKDATSRMASTVAQHRGATAEVQKPQLALVG